MLKPADAHRRLPAAGRPVARGARTLVRRGGERLRRAARDEGGDARARGAAGRSRRFPKPSTTRCCRATAICRTVSAWATATASSLKTATVLQGLGFAPARFRAAHRDLLGRLADADRARQAAARPAEPAAARRADESPGSRGPQLARNLSHRVSARGHPGVARSLLPRRRRDPHRRSDAPDADRLRRELQRLPRRASRAHRAAA